MMRASRAPFPVAASASSVATALAASKARLVSAALGPLTSDTVPTRATAMTMERREKGSCLRFITGRFLLSLPATRGSSRQSFCEFEGACRLEVSSQLRAICGTATNIPLTRVGQSFNRNSQFPIKILINLDEFTYLGIFSRLWPPHLRD